jgi:hypothetical protein
MLAHADTNTLDVMRDPRRTHGFEASCPLASMLLDARYRMRSGAPTKLERRAVSLLVRMSSLERGPVLLSPEEGRADHFRSGRPLRSLSPTG